MFSTPALMISFGRLEFTKQALSALKKSDCGIIHVIDNGSKDGTKEWLRSHVNPFSQTLMVHYLDNNYGIAYAMNNFLAMTQGAEFCIKVDNDTIIPQDFCARMLPHMQYADVVQAKHAIIPATNPEGWQGFTKNMKRENGLIYNHFVGGSGIMFRRSLITSIPETESKILGWRQWQREHPEVRKAFCEEVEIKLLDEDGYPEEYESYYKQTGRI